jgi:hypothetical protein
MMHLEKNTIAKKLAIQATQAKKRSFLAAYAETGTIKQAAKIAGIERKSHYLWLEKDPEYVEMFKSAREQAGDQLEQEARRRAIEGVPEPVWYRGQIVGEVQKYSDTLLIFLLKGAKPEKYAERKWYVEQTGPGGGPIQVDASLSRVQALTEDERKKALDELRRLDAEAQKG